MPYMDKEVIRQAEQKDISAVATFLSRATLIHRHLDWQPMLEWILKEPFLILESGDKIHAVLSAAPDPEGVAWIHCFAVDRTNASLQDWSRLLEVTSQHPVLANADICSIGLNDWYIKLLQATDFSVRQNIIVLLRSALAGPPRRVDHQVFIRAMESNDLQDVADVDRKAFEPIWVLSQETLEMAFQQAKHASVAEIEGQIVGYEISTDNHFSAHLARLAVLPDYMHHHIGSALTHEMLAYFWNKGIRDVTVNTQDDNHASVTLYRKVDFRETGESFPVYTLSSKPILI